jgi:hypothetical protein
MLTGLQRRPLRVQDVLKSRLFFERIRVPKRWEAYYRREVDTAALAVNRRHALTYAF